MIDKILTIATYTFKEIVKSKILLSVFILGIILVIITYTASEFTYGAPHRVAVDFGLGMLSLSSLGISLFLGVSLLSKEIDSRTVYMIISRPVHRFAFILGKILGLLGVQLVNLFILSFFIVLTVWAIGAGLSPLIWWAIFFIYLESILLLLVVVLCSLIANNVISTILGGVLLVLGHAIKDAQGISFVVDRPVLKTVLEFYHFILPGFYKLNLKDYVLYQTDLPFSYLFSSLSYSVLYSAFLLLMIITIFNKKNLD